MTEDLSTMTFEERHSFWNNQFRIKNEQARQKQLKLEEDVHRYWAYRDSLTGRIRHFLGIDKPEFKKNSQTTEKSPEEIQRERASFDFLHDSSPLWTGVYKKFPDGLIYYTNEISVKGKSEEEIERMQQVLQRYDIQTQVAIAGSLENKDINATEVFVSPKHWPYVPTIKEGDTVLRITDPVGNHNLPNLFGFARTNPEFTRVDTSYIPLTMEEYLSLEKERQNDAEIQKHKQQEEMEKKEITQMFESAMQDPQKRAALKQFFKTFSDKQNTTDAPVSSQNQPKRVPPLRDPKDGR